MIYDPKQRKDSVIRQVQNQFAGSVPTAALPPVAFTKPPLPLRRYSAANPGPAKPKGIFSYSVTDADVWQDHAFKNELHRLRHLRSLLDSEPVVAKLLRTEPEAFLVLLDGSDNALRKYIVGKIIKAPLRKNIQSTSRFTRTFRKPQIEGKLFLWEGKYYRILNKSA